MTRLRSSLFFRIYAFLGILFFSQQSLAATCTAAGSGSWSSAGTWTGCGGGTPLAGDLVDISGSVTLDINTTAVDRVTIQSGASLTGDGTGKISLINGTGTNDLFNDGTIDSSGANSAVLKTSTAALDITQTNANSSTWKLSTIDFSSLGATFSNITDLEFNGHATPFQNTTTTISGALTCTWTFSGSTAQTISAANITNMTTWSTGTPAFVVSNSSTTGLTLSSAMTLGAASSGSLSVASGATLTLGGTTTTMPSAASKTFDASSTVVYGGSSTQTMSAETYGNLSLSGGSTKTPAATFTVAGNLSIAVSTTYGGSTFNPALNLAGNISNSGTFTSGSGLITFNGSSGQSITGVTSFAGGIRISNATATGLTLASTGTTSISGALTVDAGAVLSIPGTVSGPSVSGVKTFNLTSTTKYSGTNQTVTALTYGNLDLSGSGTKTISAGVVIAGDLSIGVGTTYSQGTSSVSLAGDILNSGTFTMGTGILTFNGTSAQSITGVTSFGGSLSITNSTATGLTLDSSATSSITGALTLNAAAVLSIPGTVAMPTVTGAKTFNVTSTTIYAGTSQTVFNQTYGNLKLSGSGTKTLASGTHTIAGNLIIDSGVIYDGTTNFPAVSLAKDFTNNGGTFNSGTGIFTFNGTLAQTITGVTFFAGAVTIGNTNALGVTLDSSGTTSITGNLIVNASSVLSIPGTMTMPTVSGTKTFSSSSRTRYSGTNQLVAAQTYGLLDLLGSGTKTLANGTHTIAGALTIGVGVTYDGATNNPAVTMSGNLTNSGTFNSGIGILTLSGTTANTISGVTSFDGSVTISNTNTAGVTLDSSAPTSISGNLTLNAGGILSIAGTQTMPTVLGTKTFSATSKTRYSGTNQNVFAQTYGLLDLVGSGTKILDSGTHTIVGALTIGVGVTCDGDTNNPAITLSGNLSNRKPRSSTYKIQTSVFSSASI